MPNYPAKRSAGDHNGRPHERHEPRGHEQAPPVAPDAPLDEILAFLEVLETRADAMHEGYAELPPVEGVTGRTEVIDGIDGNSAGRLGCHPFPAGLNDCASEVRWTYRNRDALGISRIVVSGESGGGNLCHGFAASL